MRKRGKKHSSLALKPLGVKDSHHELSARAALLALKANCHADDHLASLYVLAELCEALNMAQSKEQYINSHAESVRRRINDIHEAGRCSHLDYSALEPSVNLLLDWFRVQPNALVAKIALSTIKRINRMQ